MSVQKGLMDSMAELAKEVHLAVSYGELPEPLQQRLGHVMKLFVALGERADAPTVETSPRTTLLEESVATVMGAESNTASIFGMGRRQRLKPQLGD